jgi:hypothetical protein
MICIVNITRHYPQVMCLWMKSHAFFMNPVQKCFGFLKNIKILFELNLEFLFVFMPFLINFLLSIEKNLTRFCRS